MLLNTVDRPYSTLIRLIGGAVIVWTVVASDPPPGGSGRGLVVLVLLILSASAWLAWTFWSSKLKVLTVDLFVLAGAGAALAGASPSSAASAFAFVAVVVTPVRVGFRRALPVVVTAVAGAAAAFAIYHGSILGLVAYSLGFLASALGAENLHQTRSRAEQAELLLAQTQRSHEEQLRAAKLEEQARIAREIHDVLAHTLAGLTIQLEATSALIEQGAKRAALLERVRRAHELAREGLRETRRAVGALRGEASPSVRAGIEALVAEYDSGAEVPIGLELEGNLAGIDDRAGEAVIRVVQEALTNVRKHAPGARVSVRVNAGAPLDGDILAVVEDTPDAAGTQTEPHALSATGGGYGLRGMRERAELLGGSLEAGPRDGGWRVELRLPALAGSDA
ncbi:MAG TPA: histidine kinase [Solirubrobacteraceae bacterium]